MSLQDPPSRVGDTKPSRAVDLRKGPSATRARWPAGAEIFKRNRRQIQIYAAIIAENLGFWPKKGIIAAASGETAEFGLAPADCDAEADAAVADLAVWNHALSSATRASDIASPSDSSCGTCRFQLVCPAFWTWLARRGLAGTPMRAPVAAAGILKSVLLGNDGDLQTIVLADVVSTQPGMVSASLVARRSIHGTLPPSETGSECRIVGAELRRDGRLAADWPTVLVPADGIGWVLVRTKTQEVLAQRAILALGPWLSRTLPEMSSVLEVTRQAVGWFMPARPETVLPGRFPLFIIERRRNDVVYGFPDFEQRGVKAAPHNHGPTVDADDWDPPATDVELMPVGNALAELVPGAAGPII